MVLTPEEFAQKMQQVHDKYDGSKDREAPHVEMDELMLTLLTDLGYGEGCKIFTKEDKWYA